MAKRKKEGRTRKEETKRQKIKEWRERGRKLRTAEKKETKDINYSRAGEEEEEEKEKRD